MIDLNQSSLKLKPSATLAINQNVTKRRNAGDTVYHFGFGQSPFPVHHSIVNELKVHANNNQYLPTLGLPILRHQIASFLKTHQNIDAQKDLVFIGPGSKELLYQTITLLEGVFLIPKGSWVSYVPQIKSKNGKYSILETHFKDNFKLIPEVLEQYCKTNLELQKTLILNSPNNPTGAVYSHTELEALALICRRYNLIVMSDEIYSQINFSEKFSPSMATYYPEKTFVFGGLSKVFSAGGYRLGFMTLPSKLQDLNTVFKALFSETFSAVASPIQYAGIEAFKMKPEVNTYVRDCSNILKGISALVFSELTNINMQCTAPQGAFYLMIGFNHFKTQINALGFNTSQQLATYILEKYSVALLPASDFYFNDDELFFRLAFVDFEGEAVLKAFYKTPKIDMQFLKQHCSNIYEGLNQIKLVVTDLSL